jgi:hypothetical protein
MDHVSAVKLRRHPKVGLLYRGGKAAARCFEGRKADHSASLYTRRDVRWSTRWVVSAADIASS